MKKTKRNETKTKSSGEPKLSPAGRGDRREDPVTRKRMIDAIFAGNTYRNACLMSGVAERTFYRWLAEGEVAAEGSVAWQFRQDIKRVEAEAIHRNLMVIQSAATKDKVWQAAAWFLERRQPEEYGRRLVEISGRQGGPVETVQVDQRRMLEGLSTTTLEEITNAADQQESKAV